jgi:hypothetical protein
MAIPPRRLSRQVAFLLRQRQQLRAQAPAYLLQYYRQHRRLPPGYVLTLLSRSDVRRIRLRGKIEHAFGLACFFVSRTSFTQMLGELWTRYAISLVGILDRLDRRGAGALRISQGAVRKAVRDGRLAAIDGFRVFYFSARSVRAFVQANGMILPQASTRSGDADRAPIENPAMDIPR